MFTPKDLAANFARSADMMRKFLDGLTHDDTLAQPSHNGNCTNWIVGHLIGSRNTLLRLSGAAEKQWQKYSTWEQHRARYGNGSQPIRADGDDVLKLAQLIEGLAATQDAINAHFGAMTPEQAGMEVEALGRKMPVGHLAIYLFGHEQYHIGQLEYTRPLSGKKNP